MTREIFVPGFFIVILLLPAEKGACENNHEFIRRVIPKGTDIGLYSESQITKMMNHINSYGRPELGDKSPFEMFAFYYGSNAL